MDDDAQGFKPPYMSFQTFWKFIKELGAKPLPPRIDRSLMASKSGTDQANLTMALSSFGLVDDESNVLPLLQQLTSADEEGRKTILADMVSRNYVGPMEVSRNNGTSKDLESVFRDNYPSIASADTRRKSVTFYLHAAREAGLDLSVHFPKTRSGSGAPGMAKPRKVTRRKSPPEQGENVLNGQAGAPTKGNTYTVELASGGTIFAIIDVDIFQLSTEDRDYVIDLVDKLKGYHTPGIAPNVKEESS
jgi:hypothetical protein